MSENLRFGLNYDVPDVRAAWGARLIIDQGGHVDLVWDRQDAFGAQEDKDALFREMEARFPVADLREEIRGSLQRYEILTRERALHTLFDDGALVVVANSNASHGYLYVRAYLRAHLIEEVPA